jgi:enterochelin esterase family protein
MIAQPEVVSPEIRPDHHVTLRVHAPDAHSVALQGVDFKSPQPMTKGSGGVWSITIGPLKPDIYSYTFLVDSATVLDPLNRNVKKWLHSENMFEIPGTPPTLSEAQPVPHGVLHRHPFFSRTRQAQAAFQVYTPPGFDPRAATQYPVVYLLHGFGDDETAWAENGRANFVADNLLAAGRTVPAIIVMPNGHPVPIPTGARFEDYSPANLAAMEHELLTEVMPLVESLYPIRRDAASRAIVGLSMGGGHALNVGLTHLDTFSWIGGFSSAAPAGKLDEKFDGLLKSTNSGSGGPRLLWIAIGKDDFLMDQNKTFVAWLDAHHVRHTWQVSDGGHEWRNWRQYLGEFLPLLFR